MIKTHSQEQCSGEYCCVHNPSDHHMRDWPMSFRPDRFWLAERFCKHGTGHPDPDSLAHLHRVGINDDGTHGCCGCCRPPKKVSIYA